MGPYNRHFLNGIDVYEAYGLIVAGGSASFMAMPKRKSQPSNNWPDEHGVEYDLSQIRFEEKQASLECTIVANTIGEFHAKRYAFYSELWKPGFQQWKVDDNDATYLVFYLDETNPRKPTGTLKYASLPAWQFTLLLKVSVNADDVPSTAAAGVTILNPDGSVHKNVPSGGVFTIPGTTVRNPDGSVIVVPPGGSYQLPGTPLGLTETHTHVSTYGNSDASITITGTGGSGSYQYLLNNSGLWTNPKSGLHTFDYLNAGIKPIAVRDSNDITKVVRASVTITQPATLQDMGPSVFNLQAARKSNVEILLTWYLSTPSVMELTAARESNTAIRLKWIN